ncbi:ABC transporter ATP-binding protein [Actinospica sp. MGRD01-02]|uniref:ABC transporter ATP-binding protein n=1 Tax=Actinospica acidithermotolerans TaxID=2828514 RepID=A0A941ILI2_9ACTN|nr:ABC transporter ATP-binding protein [Actinospica acidithermotolerans]MBR7827651.1 ABC transporter ATP-binding protein [Actinospica acidithermotolerans]
MPHTTTMATMLELTDVDTYYGASHILQGLSLKVGAGEAVALLGRNGAGKTTTMRSVLGLTPPKRGSILMDGTEIARAKTHRIARQGVAFVASGRRVFGGLTVAQNLELAARTLGKRAAADGRTLEDVLTVFPKLRELADRRAGFLSGGEQQMLKLARALLGNPRLLLLDEPTEGLSPAVVSDLGRWLDRLREQGLSILLTEQNALFALAHVDRGYVMLKGRITHEASAEELRSSEEVRAALGVG